MQDYLGAIYQLSRCQQKVTTSGLAEIMAVSAPAASSMLKRLEDAGFIDRSSSGGVKLTEQGRLSAMQLIRRHRLLEVFLVEIMDYTWDQVTAEAHRLEHAISPDFEDRIDKLCGYPTHCPHGDPIPTRDGKILTEPLISALELSPGQSGLLRRVANTDASALRYLSKLNLVPGKEIRLIEIGPISGPVTLEVVGENGRQSHSSGNQSQAHTNKVIGRELAEQLFVLPE